MSKANRGAGLRDAQNRGRGNCPVCKRTRIKVVYEKDIEGKKYMICKQCKAAIANGKMKEEIAALGSAE